MAKPWDATMKKLIRDNPQAFIQWFTPNATFVKERINELENVQPEMDELIEVTEDGELMLVNIEIQAYNDPTMAERLLQYNVLARMQFKLPVLSCVIYLMRDGNVPISPLVWTIPGGEEVLRFRFRSMEVADLSPEDILRTEQPALYTLLPLTKGRTGREKVEMMFGKLGGTGKTDLELIGFTIASLAFRKESQADQQWLIRRFRAMHDIIRETPIYQEILNEGREEGREEGLEALRQTVVDVVQKRFPKIVRLAKKLVTLVEDTTTLRHLIVDVSVAKNAEEAKQHLLAVVEDEDRE
jgi:predicted transposase/invertase (TIGR01784 family)